MNEMIERLSKVLSEEDDRAPMPTYREVAVRIITAMREPTRQIIDAQHSHHLFGTPFPMPRAAVEMLWQAMIDEALK